MVLYFLILVCICLITGYFLLKKSHSEIAHLLGVFGTISLFLALFLAPWQILLLVLITAFITTNSEYRISKSNTRQIGYPQHPRSKCQADHHLIYRGAYYCTNSNTKWDGLTPSLRGYQLSYRGSNYVSCIDSYTQTSRATLSSATCQLRFRGSSYYIKKTTLIKNQRSLELNATSTTSLPITN